MSLCEELISKAELDWKTLNIIVNLTAHESVGKLVDLVLSKSECLEKAEVRFVKGKTSCKLRKKGRENSSSDSETSSSSKCYKSYCDRESSSNKCSRSSYSKLRDSYCGGADKDSRYYSCYKSSIDYCSSWPSATHQNRLKYYEGTTSSSIDRFYESSKRFYCHECGVEGYPSRYYPKVHCYKCLTREHFAWDCFKESRSRRSTSSSDEKYSSSKDKSGSRVSCVKTNECKKSGNEKVQ